MGFAYRKHFFNEKFFDEINSEDKAYFLGLLCADGYSSVAKNVTVISLQEKDKDILDMFKEKINYKENLTFIKGGLKNNGKIHQNSYALYLNSKYLSNSLLKLGIDTKKTESLEFNTFNNFTNDFIRGYFDGDGCLMLPKNTNSWYFSIISSTKFIKGLKEYIKLELDINSSIYKPKNYQKEVSILSIRGNKQLLKFLNWMYKDSNIYLNRKYQKYNEFLEKYKILKTKVEKKCSIENCNKISVAHELCNSHYTKFRKGTLDTIKLLNKDKNCLIENCNKNVFSKNLCRMHYNKNWLKNKNKIEGKQ